MAAGRIFLHQWNVFVSSGMKKPLVVIGTKRCSKALDSDISNYSSDFLNLKLKRFWDK
jgi:hypothetical protein